MYSGGSGTLNSPYLIANATDLKNIESNMGAYFKQTNDITLGTFEPIGYNSGSGTPINFTGTYNGNGFAIQNGTINYPALSYVGVFRRVVGTIKNLYLNNISVSGDGYVGILAGSFAGTLAYIYIDEYSSVTAASTYCGGIIGERTGSGGTVNRCYNKATVSGYSTVGGIVGYNNQGSITNSYNTGNVTASLTTAGGIVGRLTSYATSIVRYCYNTGDITTPTYGGGIVGYKDGNNGFVDKCFALNSSIIRSSGTDTNFARVCCSTPVGLTDNYALDTMTEAFTSSWSAKSTTEKDGADITLANAKKEATYSTLSWNFLCIWDISEDAALPYLNAFLIGQGTLNDPYLVNNATQLQEITQTYTGHFKQNCDITLGNFTPLCTTLSNALTGSYDGNGYTLKDGTIGSESTVNSGLFAHIGGEAAVKNVILDNIDVLGLTRVGGIAGSTSSSSSAGVNIMNCWVKSTCSITSYSTDVGANTGGIIGFFGVGAYSKGMLQCCINDAPVNGYYNTGGIVGDAFVDGQRLLINYCINNGTVSASKLLSTAYTGGIIGYAGRASSSNAFYIIQLDQCINTGNIYCATGYVGGIAGYLNVVYFSITRCYALNATLGGSSASCHRICGETKGEFNYNYALDTMTGDTFDQKTSTGIDGADITYENSILRSTYSANGYNLYPWSDEDGIPSYIVEDRIKPDLTNKTLNTVTSMTSIYYYDNNPYRCMTVDANNNVYFATRKNTNPNVFYVFKCTDGTWTDLSLPQALGAYGTGDRTIPGAALYYSDNKVYVAFMEKKTVSTNDIYLFFNIYDTVAGTWKWASNSLEIDIHGSFPNHRYCDMLIHDSTVHVLYKYNTSLRHISSSNDGDTWSAIPIDITTNTSCVGSLAVHNNTLWCVFGDVGNPDTIYETYYSSGSWSTPANIATLGKSHFLGYEATRVRCFSINSIQYIIAWSSGNSKVVVVRKSASDTNYIEYFRYAHSTSYEPNFYISPDGIPFMFYTTGEPHYQMFYDKVITNNTLSQYVNTSDSVWAYAYFQQTNRGYVVHIVQCDSAINRYISYSSLDVSYQAPVESFYKIYNGSEWVTVPMKTYNGSEWVNINTKVYSGSEWA